MPSGEKIGVSHCLESGLRPARAQACMLKFHATQRASSRAFQAASWKRVGTASSTIFFAAAQAVVLQLAVGLRAGMDRCGRTRGSGLRRAGWFF
jgi:hypothetical protein